MPTIPTINIDPNLHSAVFAGHIIVGPADGTWCTVEQGADVATKTVGAKGDVTFIYSADRSATVTIRLKPGSPSNRVLQRFADAKTRGPFEFRDMNQTDAPVIIRCPVATIATRPGLGRGAEETVNEWTFILDVTQQEV